MLGILSEEIGKSTYLNITKYGNLDIANTKFTTIDRLTNSSQKENGIYLIEDNRENNYILRVFPTNDSKEKIERIVNYSKISSYYLPSTYFIEKTQEQVSILGGYYNTQNNLTTDYINTLNSKQKVQIIYGLFSAINALHNEKIYHGNIKEENIFIQNINNTHYPIISNLNISDFQTYEEGAQNDLKSIQKVISLLFNVNSTFTNIEDHQDINKNELIEVIKKTIMTTIDSSQISEKLFLLENQKAYQELFLDKTKIEETVFETLHNVGNEYHTDGLHNYVYHHPITKIDNFDINNLAIKNQYCKLIYCMEKSFGLFSHNESKSFSITENYSNYSNFIVSENISSNEKIGLLIDLCHYVNFVYKSGGSFTNLTPLNLFIKNDEKEKKILYKPIKEDKNAGVNQTISIRARTEEDEKNNIRLIGDLLKYLIQLNEDLTGQYDDIYANCDDEFDINNSEHFPYTSLDELIRALTVQYRGPYFQENEYEFFDIEGKGELFRKKKIMAGGEGEVWKIETLDKKRTYALKEYSYEARKCSSDIRRKRITREFRNLKTLCENIELLEKSGEEVHITKPISLQKRVDKALVIMEYISKGNLGDEITEGNLNTTFNDKINFMEDIIKALKVMHDSNILHRDIKPDNILIKDLTRYKAYLCDFGNSKNYENEVEQITVDPKDIIRSIGYYPPELLEQNNSYKEYSDIFSLGITFYTMMTGIHCYFGKDIRFGIDFQSKYINELNKREKITIEDEGKIEYFKAMIEKMCEHDYTKRYQNCNELLRDFGTSQKNYNSKVGGRK